jgi:hypothetical protein
MPDILGSNKAALCERPEPVATITDTRAKSYLEPVQRPLSQNSAYSTDLRIKATSMIGTTIGGTNHEAMRAARKGTRNPRLSRR